MCFDNSKFLAINEICLEIEKFQTNESKCNISASIDCTLGCKLTKYKNDQITTKLQMPY